MAVTKEAIAIVLDVGLDMHIRDTPSVLENAKNCINMIIQRKIFSESKDEIALILFGSQDTKNNLADKRKSQYQNVEVCQELKPASWELLEFVNKIKGTTISADFIDGLIVAMDILYNNCYGSENVAQRILIFSNFGGDFNIHGLNKVLNSIKRHKMELLILGPVSYADEETSQSCSTTYSTKTPTQIKAENTIKKILKEVNGESYSFNDVLPALIYYQKKKVQPIPWNANLDIGTNLTIPISAYIKVNEFKPKSWKNAYAHKLNAKLERGTSYFINDDAQAEVPKEGIIPAYRYGTTLVPYTEEDKMNMEYQSGEKGMKVLGFTKAENVQRFHHVGDKTMYVYGQKNRELAGVILAPFIHALHDTKMVAVVRYVYSARSAPKIGFLAPKIKQHYECLVFITLPFMEDLRHFVFSPLDGNPNNLPSDEQLNAVDELITAMDLTATYDEDGNENEELKPKYTVNPYLQRLYQCLQFKAFHPDKPLPDISPQIKAIINPSEKVLKIADSALNRVKSVFSLRETSQKKNPDTTFNLLSNGKSENTRKRKLSDDSGIDSKLSIIEDVIDPVTKIGTINPVRDFQEMIKSKDPHDFFDAIHQIVQVVWTYLKDERCAKLYHSKILGICKELRASCLKVKQTTDYNTFITTLQSRLFEIDPDLWMKIRNESIGLISRSEVGTSAVSPEEAEAFLTVTPYIKTENVNNEEDFASVDNSDYDALLDEM
ncbi:X-ray repair cross-complementing protein 5-like isoform X2 [Uloborus diversus]|uniref:X-ray repair cross-complementing protein 5-like isoform X2 n=1 Tax=Uloborus diversus TaxID=327109 RepID=UPI00240A77DF|nr:X-ray repair cross-complementing protein 5-like isoform X2 [Uloborus diversus]